MLPGLFVVVLFVALFWRSAAPELAVINGRTMGTTYTVKVVDVEDAKRDELSTAVDDAIQSVNTRMSTYQDDSELMTFNASGTEPFAASEELRMVINAAQTVSEKTAGAFDITIGPIVNAYGFGPKSDKTPPTDDELEKLRETVGFGKLAIDGSALKKERADLFVDLSAIAKGYGVDKAAAAVEAMGYQNYMVEIGGEVRARGVNDAGEAWRLGIETPDAEARKVQRIVQLRDQALATSGDYRKYYEKDGVRISHTIDARTGKPITHGLASVSVVHSDCMHADAWATALNVLGEKEGLELAEKEGLAALFIVRNGEGFEEIETTAFKKLNARN